MANFPSAVILDALDAEDRDFYCINRFRADFVRRNLSWLYRSNESSNDMDEREIYRLMIDHLEVILEQLNEEHWNMLVAYDLDQLEEAFV